MTILGGLCCFGSGFGAGTFLGRPRFSLTGSNGASSFVGSGDSTGSDVFVMFAVFVIFAGL